MIQIADADIGGARVARTFTFNGRHMKRGETLTAEQVLSINTPNRRALIDSNFIEVWPKPHGKRYMLSVGKDRYNVIEGRMLNERPLTREEAEELVA